MPDVVVPKNALSLGAGYLYWSAPLTAEPDWTVAGSVFTGAWAGWTLLGITREGHTFTYSIDTDTIDAAEYLDPLLYVTTGRTAGISFDMMQVHAQNFRRALNAPSGSVTVTGSGATQRNTFRPPAVGNEVRCQIGWESADNDERMIALQAFQIGNVEIQRQRGASNASIPVEFRFEIDTNGDPFRYETAGPLRA